MDFETFERQAQAICDAVPFWSELPDATLDEFRIRLIVDLAKIGLICGYADGRFDSKESLFAAVVFSRILHRGQESKQEGADHGQSLDTEAALRFFSAARKEELDTLTLPALVQRYDDERGTASFDRLACAMYRFASYLVKADGTVTQEEVAALRQVWRLIHSPSTEPPQGLPRLPGIDGETAEDLLDDLASLVGLPDVKTQVRTLYNRLRLDRERSERGLSSDDAPLHSLFFGCAGSGKSRVGKLLSKLYRQLGILERGHLVELDASLMIAGSTDNGCRRLQQAVDSAMDGTLLINQSHRLSPAYHDHGRALCSAILQQLTQHKGRLVVVLAGEPDQLRHLVEEDGDLRSRFRRRFQFDDLRPEELLQGFDNFAGNSGFRLTPEARHKLHLVFEVLHDNRDFVDGNARIIRSLFERTVERQANRIAGVAPITDQLLMTIQAEDIPPATWSG